MDAPVPADERRHPPSDHPLWEESWQLDVTTSAGDLGASVRLGLLPNQGRSWVWASVVGDGRRLVTVVEDDAPLPRRGALDLRCEGLWTDLVCETPLEHWSVGLEAFGVALDEPADAFRGLRGERIGVGLDLGWETVGAPVPDPSADRYVVHCDVHGEVLVGDEVLPVAGWGTRHHAWGVHDWWAGPWSVGAGRLDDGTRWHASVPGAGPGTGAVVRTRGPARRAGTVTAEDDGRSRPDGLPAAAGFTLDELRLDAVVDHLSPVPLLAPDGRAGRLTSALCRTTADDGTAGRAWLAWNRPDRP